MENTATLLITFCFSLTGLCFALSKNCMKTQSYVTRYAAPPWNSSITFLVFYLCKQKRSSNQCRLSCWKSGVWISVSRSFFLTSLRCRYPPKRPGIAFFPSCFLNRIPVFQCSLNLFKVESWNFLRQSSGFTKNELFSVFHEFTERWPRTVDSTRTHTFIFPFSTMLWDKHHQPHLRETELLRG